MSDIKIIKKLKEHDKRFNEISKTLINHDKRFDEHDKRFDNLDERFDKLTKITFDLEARFDAFEIKIDKRFDQVMSAMDTFARDYKGVKIEQLSLGRVVSRHETDIIKIKKLINT